jgi:phospholipid/cholesterol/gamma-HCH transport system ATP-binding protein
MPPPDRPTTATPRATNSKRGGVAAGAPGAPANAAAAKPKEDPGTSRVQIAIRGVHKSFGVQHVLRGIDLDIDRGKINIIIGGSGQGKSVLMKLLMGLLKPEQGQILVDGQDLVPLNDVEWAKLRRKYGMVFQYAALFDSLNVVENIAFPLIERYHLSRDEIMVRVRDLLQKLDLSNVGGIEQKFPAELSGGQRKRVGLARALIDRPEILLYDEPTTGLDPVATKNVDDMIIRASQDFGVTSVVISHDMASTFRIADRVSMLYEGKILVSGTAQEVLHSGYAPVQEFVQLAGLLPTPGGAAGGATAAPAAPAAPAGSGPHGPGSGSGPTAAGPAATKAGASS